MIFIFAFAQLAAAEKLRIVEKVHAYANQRDEQIQFGPTLAPPLAYKSNHLFDGDAPCQDYSDTVFKYTLCPCQNLTQRSHSQFDSSAHVLGVFGGFLVDNYRFSALEFVYGDSDGCDGHRQARIIIKCGEKLALSNITEPNRCQYQGILEYPAACDDDRLLVYPLLSSASQSKWDKVASDRANGFITPVGYETFLRQILVDEGFAIDRDNVEKSEAFRAAKAKSEENRECAKEIEELKDENARLRSDLATCYSQNMEEDDFDPAF